MLLFFKSDHRRYQGCPIKTNLSWSIQVLRSRIMLSKMLGLHKALHSGQRPARAQLLPQFAKKIQTNLESFTLTEKRNTGFENLISFLR